MGGNLTDDFALELFEERRRPGEFLPTKRDAETFVQRALAILFPHFSSKIYISREEIRAELALLGAELERALEPVCSAGETLARDVAGAFIGKLPGLYRSIKLDAEAIDEGDPASESVDEVVLAYPGFYAIAVYRMAHEFYLSKIPLFPRLLSEFAHRTTGIDIHPGAEIGSRFFIDHGTGVVVGETCEIGDNVKIYQGVTLGALSVEKKLYKKKRHPTIEDNVIIYSGATILGGDTVIGKDSVIGGNVWLTESVAPGSIVYNKSEIRIRRRDATREIDFVI